MICCFALKLGLQFNLCNHLDDIYVTLFILTFSHRPKHELYVIMYNFMTLLEANQVYIL